MKMAEKGYHPKIGEDQYVDELNCFINAIKGKEQFINTLEEDHKVLKLLYAIEESDKISKYVDVRFD